MASLPANQRVRSLRITSFIRRNPIVLLPISIILLFIYVMVGLSADRAARNTPEAKAKAAQEAQAADDALDVQLARDLVTTRLRDPDSAQFLGVHLVRRGVDKGVCGYVNGRNGFGGMAGNVAFAVFGTDVVMANDAYPKDLKRLDSLCNGR